MIQHIWTVPCRLGITDRDSNSVSLIEILEEVVIPTEPPTPETAVLAASAFEVVTLWGRATDAPAKGLGRLVFVPAEGEPLEGEEYEIDLTQHTRTRVRVRLLGFPTQAAGVCWFRVEYRPTTAAPWVEVARVPIWVRVAAPA